MEIIWRRSKEEEKEDADLKKELRLIEAQLRKIKKTGKTNASDQQGTTSANPEATANSLFQKHSPGVPYLQSQRLANPVGALGLSKTLITKMELVLKELGIEGRLLPTKTVCDMYDQLRKNVVTLLTLQKIAKKKENTLLQKKLDLRRAGLNMKQEEFEVIPEVVVAPVP